MSASIQATPAKPVRLCLELALVLGLPLFAIFAAGALAITAYTRGFSPLPAPAAQSSAQH